MYPNRRFRLSLFFAILIVLVSEWGIVSWQKGISKLSVENLGPLAEVEGRLAKVEEKKGGLDIRLKDNSRRFRGIGSYPEKYHLGSQIAERLKVDQQFVLTVPQKELEERPLRKRWKSAEFARRENKIVSVCCSYFTKFVSRATTPALP